MVTAAGTKCGAEKTLADFRQRKLRDGTFAPTSWCRVCLNESSKLSMRRRLEDPAARERAMERDKCRYQAVKADPVRLDAERRRKREYFARPEVRARAAERSKLWNAQNPDRVLEKHRRWRDGNREKVRAASLKYRTEHYEAFRDSSFANQSRRRWEEHNHGPGFTIQHARLCRVFWNNRCAYCGTAVVVKTLGGHGQRAAGFDHVVPLSKGGAHDPANHVVCCKPCNDKKNARIPPPEIMAKLEPQLDAFVSCLPANSFHRGRCGPPTLEMQRAVFEAEARLKGRGVPVGTWW